MCVGIKITIMLYYKKVMFIYLFLSTFLNAQDKVLEVSDCYGAVNIDNAGDFNIKFTGKVGYEDDLKGFPNYKHLSETNPIWATFQAPFDGTFSLKASSQNIVSLIVFKINSNDACGSIHKGLAEVERFIENDSLHEIGLNVSKQKGFLYPIQLNQGEVLYFYFNSKQENRESLNMNIHFKPVNVKEISADMKKEVDMRDPHKNTPTFRVALRDHTTGLPVKGQLVIKESRSLNAMYRGTDYYFPIKSKDKLHLSIDAPGYFFHDQDVELEEGMEKEVIVWMTPASDGSLFELKGIEFKMGSSDFMPGAEARLKRLRDFLLLNSGIHIEIQGHVHELGDGTFSGKRMSVARAKKVQNYLIENGVDKHRLDAVGYGNEKMIYPEAKLSSEEQANRRVDIKILKIED